MSLKETIRVQLHNQGKMPFAEFMHQALYTPSSGYYSARTLPFGATGDFITAPELSPLFAYTLANQCQPILASLENPILFEFGAGSGRLCVDLLTQLERMDSLPEAYHILEVSAHLKECQFRLIQTEIPHLLEKVTWLSTWPSKTFSGIVIANEVLDAMPAQRFVKSSDELLLSYVMLNESDEFCEVFLPCTDQRMATHLANILPELPNLYQSEANFFIEGWIGACYDMMDSGVCLLIDYGFPRHEYYHPDRNQGTLMCHYRHQAHPNPFVYIGEQDITAHVDFTHVAEAACDAGFQVAGYTNQASFLLANGMLNFLEKIEHVKEQWSAREAVKKLTQPHEMGELFKVMALTKLFEEPLQGFEWYDKRVSL